jgi:hypothetical protein
MTGSFAETGPYEGTILLGCIEDETGTMEDIIRRGTRKYPGLIGWMSCSVFSTVPGLIQHAFDGSDRSDIGIPVWDSGLENIRPIRDFMRSDAPNRTVIIEVDFDDVNEWTVVNDSGAKIAFSVFVGGFAFAVAGVAISKLVMFIRAQGPTRNLPQIILWIELFANLERGVFSVVDPFLSRYIFPLLAAHLLATISIPAYATTSLLITLYWKEVLSNKQMKVVTFLDRMKVPFFVLVSLTWAIEIINACFRAYGVGPIFIMLTIVSIFYLIISLLTAIFFLHYGRKLLATLDDPGVKKANHKSSKFKAVRMLIVSSVLELVYSALLVLPATPVYVWPWGFFACNFIGFLLMIAISLLKILAFVAPSGTPKQSLSPRVSEAMMPRTLTASKPVSTV